ncbi:ligase-associated DNA damage response DEXH box helicase [Henriciella algicola]|uniref:Ligase-associated DNA damage response DEXH box helicase n=1 Tax=Henriciella algicola TaxID=1608422 RepID=A0A399RM71_9PROT|nr:ligase-associated DNA damage response DEXH box helicase [Henriciella algicola]RIJ31533.1 ligase-associated DNA damage response DEXH box helicase [Henriciella algicola]
MSLPMPDAARPDFSLPDRFSDWFASRNWVPRKHQLDLTETALAGDSALLIAPTGGGKTLAGFMASLIELSQRPKSNSGRPALHTLYISPLKALATDVERNLNTPVAEMGLDVRIETRTGDTPQSKRQRQRSNPPDILLTTPEQLALFLASDHADEFFSDLKCVIIDEIHAIAASKRGDLLSLGLATLAEWAPACRFIGLSATVRDPDQLAGWLDVRQAVQELPPPFTGEVPEGRRGQAADATHEISPLRAASRPTSPAGGGGVGATSAKKGVHLVHAEGGTSANIDILVSRERIPWSGHSGRFAVPEVYEAIKEAEMALVFVNTRSQAEMLFQELWRANEDALPIALHHGSLAREQRRKVEAAMAAGVLKGVVCTSTLDLGIDWGGVDLVIQMGAPKGAARLIQRIGRANHRMDEASRALLVPTNRFEILECRAAEAAVEAGEIDGEPMRLGALDVLAQHIMGRACGVGFELEPLFNEIRRAAPYEGLDWETYERVVDLVATGGYALKTYDRFKRIVRGRDGIWRVRTARDAQQHRMNVGAIVEAQLMNVRLTSFVGKVGEASGGEELKKVRGDQRTMRAGRKLGEIEEYFISTLTPGDTFLFAGEILRFLGVSELDVLVTRAKTDKPAIPTYNGGKFPLTTFLADRVRHMIHDPDQWSGLPDQVREWFEIQREKSEIPPPDHLLVETFPRAGRHYLVTYPFEGRLAHQTLGMLLTRRLERAGAKPLGFVASEYAMAIWAMEDMGSVDMDGLFHPDMLGDDLEEWLDESPLMKRTFAQCAQTSGVIARRLPGKEKTGRQVTFSTDLIYDVLRSHEPDHILLQAARQDAATGLLDIRRLSDMLTRIRGKIDHRPLMKISPFAVPVMLEVGRERVNAEGVTDAILREAEMDIIQEAMGR